MDRWISSAKLLYINLISLGHKKLMAMSVAMVATIFIAALSAFILTRPKNEVLYAGLSKQDAAKISAALRDFDIEFDLSSDSSTMYVRNGQAPRVRMKLAQRGLPNSTANGYELFEKVGAFGLTAFMQDVTRTRAIEGELSRTLQMIDGMKAARVHLVLPSRSGLRTAQQEPSASVILQMDSVQGRAPISAIRHLIAAAVPNLNPKNITIASSNGDLLSGPEDLEAGSGSAMRRVESDIARIIKDNIQSAIGVYLPPEHLRVSVALKINMDRREIAEKLFIPDSKVERSVRITRESSDSQNLIKDTPVSIQQNIPRQEQSTADDRKKSEVTQKREELTNFEISSRSTNMISHGYQIEHLSIAVSLNRKSIPSDLRSEEAKDKLDKYLRDIEQLASAAAGMNQKRGDLIKVAIMDFDQSASSLIDEDQSKLKIIIALIPSALQSISAILIVLSIIFLVIKPTLRVAFSKNSDDVHSKILLEAPGRNDSLLESQTYSVSASQEDISEGRRKLREALQGDRLGSVSVMKGWLSTDVESSGNSIR